MGEEDIYICKDCGHVDIPKKIVKGSIGIELCLWLLIILPGLI